ncbi:hypothetical protein Tco_0031659 [Tanacetum coccineum]
MSRKSAWVGLVNKLQARLSKWKVKTLSIGGRLTLLKSVLGASPIYYMSIFKVPKGVFIDYGSIRSKFLQNVLILLRIGRFRGSLFPRLFALELDKEIVVANKMGASSAHPQLLFAGLLDGS